jgi:hypothetical protein
VSTIRAWSLLALCLGLVAWGANELPPAATSPFMSHGAPVDQIALEGASLVLLGADGTRAELNAGTLGIDHLSLDDALFTIQRGLVAGAQCALINFEYPTTRGLKLFLTSIDRRYIHEASPFGCLDGW